MKRSWMGGFALVALCTAGSAFAAIDATRVAPEIKYDENQTKVGVDVRVGVGGLTGDAGRQTAPGPLIGITAGAQPWRLIGLEAGVEGQRLPIDDARVGDNQALYRYNVGILGKVGPLLVNDQLRPYVGAGVGMSYINVTNGAEALYSNDFIEEVPVAAGLDYRFTQNIYAGARATYRVLFGEEFADTANADGDTSGNLLNVGLMVGGRF